MTDPRGDGGAVLLPHLIVEGSARTEQFRSPVRGRAREVPRRNRRTHSAALRRDLERVTEESAVLRAESTEALEHGFTVEFESFPEVELAFESLSRERSGIELLNVRRDGEITRATVFVPDGKLVLFERIIADYAAAKRSSTGRALDHRSLVDTIASIRIGTLQALWTDAAGMFPGDSGHPLWWEVWLSVRGHRQAVVQDFRIRAGALDIRVAVGEVAFPERTVLLCFASREQLTRSVALLNLIAELRKGKETAEFFDSLPVSEQVNWVSDLLTRCDFAPSGSDVPHVCILDTGITNAHPLLAPVLDRNDMHTVEPAWGLEDQQGHGTEMAGLAAFGDLTPILSDVTPVVVLHRLESVKLLPHDGANVGDARHHAYLTMEAAARPEIASPRRSRVFSLSVSSLDRERGRPSAWSAAVDALAADSDGEGDSPRLFVVCAGNADPTGRGEYPASNTTDSIHDPGQAWNALTVGSSTEFGRITEPDAQDYQPVAVAGGLSPFSTTSATWAPQWPLKPDVLCEGGNASRDALGTYTTPSLSLLSTFYRPVQRLLTTSVETSASTAACARMAAQLWAVYRQFRPETIRALIVHSADWTPEMRRMFLPNSRQPNRNDIARLIRHCGFGNPDLGRAMWSASNSLAMVVEDELQPFARDGSKDITLRDMRLHELPWPRAELEELGAVDVEMRVTLSYFVEPNPSARAGTRYAYQSHGLRFDVRRAEETTEAFRARVNRAARAEEEQTVSAAEDSGWVVGKNTRHRGSIHSDIWRGSAADLARRGVLAVYPALGWWKTRARLQQYDRRAAYSLIVSIRAPTVPIDLYSSVLSQIQVRVAAKV